MDRQCKVRTVTENTDKNIKITCVAYENQYDIELPTLFNAEVLQIVKAKNAVKGKEGELIITHEDSNKVVSELNKSGEMIITLNDDDVNRYRLIDKTGVLVYDMPAIIEYLYAGWEATTKDKISFSEDIEGKSADVSEKKIIFTVNNANVLAVVCPRGFKLISAIKKDEIDDDITKEMLDSKIDVIYKNRIMNMYQFKYLTGIMSNANFTLLFE